MTNTNLLKGAMAAKGFTQAQLARHLNLSATALNNKLQNKTVFTAVEILGIRRALNLSVAESEAIFFNSLVD